MIETETNNCYSLSKGFPKDSKQYIKSSLSSILVLTIEPCVSVYIMPYPAANFLYKILLPWSSDISFHTSVPNLAKILPICPKIILYLVWFCQLLWPCNKVSKKILRAVPEYKIAWFWAKIYQNWPFPPDGFFWKILLMLLLPIYFLGKITRIFLILALIPPNCTSCHKRFFCKNLLHI